MKIFVSTKDGRKKQNDFHWTNDNEIVLLPSRCCDSPTCGCDRAFIGLETRRSTTKAKIIESQMTKKKFYDAVRESTEKAGWAQYMTDKDIKEEADCTIDMAKEFPLGAVVSCSSTKHEITVKERV